MNGATWVQKNLINSFIFCHFCIFSDGKQEFPDFFYPFSLIHNETENEEKKVSFKTLQIEDEITSHVQWLVLLFPITISILYFLFDLGRMLKFHLFSCEIFPYFIFSWILCLSHIYRKRWCFWSIKSFVSLIFFSSSSSFKFSRVCQSLTLCQKLTNNFSKKLFPLDCDLIWSCPPHFITKASNINGWNEDWKNVELKEKFCEIFSFFAIFSFFCVKILMIQNSSRMRTSGSFYAALEVIIRSSKHAKFISTLHPHSSK